MNYWFGEVVGFDFLFKFKFYLEKKSGGIFDLIFLMIEGVGVGEYFGVSGGECRWFDVVILFVFLEVVWFLVGEEVLMFFFDEVFDVFDEDG